MKKKTISNIPPSFYVVDKPEGWSSHKVVGCFRAMLGRPKTGHTGTLDPFATGVLVIAVGQATRWISFLKEDFKTYLATIRLGQKTTTGDKEGDVVETCEIPTLDHEVATQVLNSFLGRSIQTAPVYSALKKNGKPLYEYARKGIPVEPPKREITISSIQLIDLNSEYLTFECSVSKGSYIRSLGEDIALALGTVGHLTALRRISSGPFHIRQCLSLSELARAATGLDCNEKAFDRDCRDEFPWQEPHLIFENLNAKRIEIKDAFSHLPRHEIQQQYQKAVSNGMLPHAVLPGLPKSPQYLLTVNQQIMALASCVNGDHSLIRVLTS